MSKTYEQFIKDSPDFIICAHGETSALGFRGNHELINSAWYLFCNYDKEKALHWVKDDLAYINLSVPRIRAALKLFLYVNILNSQEVPSKHEWNEETGEFTIVQNTELVTQMAEQDVNHFITNLETQSFIPLDTSTPAREYTMGE